MILNTSYSISINQKYIMNDQQILKLSLDYKFQITGQITVICINQINQIKLIYNRITNLQDLFDRACNFNKPSNKVTAPSNPIITDQFYDPYEEELKLIPGADSKDQNNQKSKPSSRVNRHNYYRGDRSKPILSPEAEILLSDWIASKLIKKIYVRRKDIARKARKLSECEGFSASKGWVNRFLSRHAQMKMELNRIARINKGKRAGQRYNQVQSSDDQEEEESFGDIEKYIAEQNEQRKNKKKEKVKLEQQSEYGLDSDLSDQKWIDFNSQEGYEEQRANTHNNEVPSSPNVESELTKRKNNNAPTAKPKIQNNLQTESKYEKNGQKFQQSRYSQTSSSKPELPNQSKQLKPQVSQKKKLNEFIYGNNMSYSYDNNQQSNRTVYQNELRPEPKKKNVMYGYQYIGKEKQKVRDIFGSTK